MKITTRNAKLAKALINLINCMKDRTTKEKFNDYKETMIRITIERENKRGNFGFASCKELKEYIINEKINEIKNDFV